MLQFLSASDFVNPRNGEQKIGENFLFLESDWKSQLDQLSQQFVLLGIQEDIGPQANLGQGGAANFFPAFFQKFANLQDNQFLSGKSIAVLGKIDFPGNNKTNPTGIDQLRNAVELLDQQLTEILLPIFKAGKTPIVVGGGHNNAYPLIKAFSVANNQGVQVLNIDAHADFRNLEGRHSGNGFSYAFSKGYLKHYAILGLQKNYNSQNLLEQLNANKIAHLFLEDLDAENRDPAFIQQWLDLKLHSKLKLGLELDLDSISDLKSSAQSKYGFALHEATKVISYIAQQRKIDYLNLTEGIADAAGQTPKSAALILAQFLNAQLHYAHN